MKYLIIISLLFSLSPNSYCQKIALKNEINISACYGQYDLVFQENGYTPGHKLYLQENGSHLDVAVYGDSPIIELSCYRTGKIIHILFKRKIPFNQYHGEEQTFHVTSEDSKNFEGTYTGPRGTRAVRMKADPTNCILNLESFTNLEYPDTFKSEWTPDPKSIVNLCYGEYTIGFDVNSFNKDHSLSINAFDALLKAPGNYGVSKISHLDCIPTENGITLRFHRNPPNDPTKLNDYQDFELKSNDGFNFEGTCRGQMAEYSVKMNRITPTHDLGAELEDIRFNSTKYNNETWDHYTHYILNNKSNDETCSGYIKLAKVKIYLNGIIDKDTSFEEIYSTQCILSQDKLEKIIYFTRNENGVNTEYLFTFNTLNLFGTNFLEKKNEIISSLQTQNIFYADQNHEQNSSLCNWTAIQGKFSINKKAYDVILQSTSGEGIKISSLSKKSAYLFPISNSFCFQINATHARAGIRINNNDSLFDIYSNSSNTNMEDKSNVMLKSPVFKQEKLKNN